MNIKNKKTHMKKEIKDWTHTGVKIKDIRKLKNFYIIELDIPEVNTPVLIKEDIFIERIESYFLKDIKQLSREDITGVTYDMVVTKGYFVKPDKNGGLIVVDKEMANDKWYVSFFEIPGPLVSFSNIISKR